MQLTKAQQKAKQTGVNLTSVRAVVCALISRGDSKQQIINFCTTKLKSNSTKQNVSALYNANHFLYVNDKLFYKAYIKWHRAWGNKFRPF